MAGLSLSPVLVFPVLVLLLSGALVFLLLSGAGKEGRESSPGEAGGHPNAAGAAVALQSLVGALERGSVREARALAPSDDRSARDLLEGIVGNARSLRLTDVEARYVDHVSGHGEGGSWTAEVDLTWRYAGFDDEVARAAVLVDLVAVEGGVAIAGFPEDRDRGRIRPLWLQPALSVVRRGPVLAVVDGPRSVARQVAARAGRGTAVVRRTLPGWKPAVVVEVPSSTAALDTVLGAAPGTHEDIAAVTATADGSTRPEAPIRVLLNPEALQSSRSALAVMTHEIAHVATGATTSSMDEWLREGFADYVALRGLRPDQTTMARAVDLVGQVGVPADLPGRTAFDAEGPGLEAAYEMAWLACVVIADEIGPEGLVAAHRDVAAGTPVEEALARAGLRRGRLLLLWQARLRDLTR